MFRLHRFAVLGTLLIAHAAVFAQGTDTWPSKPVSLIVPFTPGGSTDAEARVYSQKLTENLGKSVVLDYKPGAGSVLGMNYVAKAAGDGHTLLIMGPSIAIAPSSQKSLPYDPAKDLLAVSVITKRPIVLTVNPSLPIRTPAEYIAYAKANPGKLNFGTPGMGGSPHLNGEWLSSIADIKMTFVHYKGVAQQYVDLMAGRNDAAYVVLGTALPLIKSGKLRVIGYASLVTSPLLSNVPVIGEQAAPGLDYTSWLGIGGPGTIPPALLTRIHGELQRMARSPDVAQRFESEGVVTVAMTPHESRTFVAAETARWRTLVKDRGITFEE